VAVRRRPRGAPPARRSHQQHFLRSTRLAAEIVRDADLRRRDLVLDIGAGTGVLSAELARRCERVRAIEIDGSLVARLHQRFVRTPQVEVVHGDALRLPLPGEPFRVVANTPFNACTSICRRLLDDPRVPLERADLIVELAVAWKRARVSPCTALGVYWGAWHEFAVTRRIDRSAFAPAASVDAGLLRITRRAEPLVPASEAAAYKSLVTAGFERRALREVVSRRELNRLALELGFSADAPPWGLDQHQWAGLFRYVRRRQVDSPGHEPL
jgi:23S rRNA (adenine-N6)-dimethyltransferase